MVFDIILDKWNRHRFSRTFTWRLLLFNFLVISVCQSVCPSRILRRSTHTWRFLRRILSAMRWKTHKKLASLILLRWFLRNKSYRWIFLETFPKCSLPRTVSKNTIKKMGHHSRLRDVVAQSYPIYASTRANRSRYSSVNVTFCGSSKHNS